MPHISVSKTDIETSDIRIIGATVPLVGPESFVRGELVVERRVPNQDGRQVFRVLSYESNWADLFELGQRGWDDMVKRGEGTSFSALEDEDGLPRLRPRLAFWVFRPSFRRRQEVVAKLHSLHEAIVQSLSSSSSDQKFLFVDEARAEGVREREATASFQMAMYCWDPPRDVYAAIDNAKDAFALAPPAERIDTVRLLARLHEAIGLKKEAYEYFQIALGLEGTPSAKCLDIDVRGPTWALLTDLSLFTAMSMNAVSGLMSILSALEREGPARLEQKLGVAQGEGLLTEVFVGIADHPIRALVGKHLSPEERQLVQPTIDTLRALKRGSMSPHAHLYRQALVMCRALARAGGQAFDEVARTEPIAASPDDIAAGRR